MNVEYDNANKMTLAFFTLLNILIYKTLMLNIVMLVESHLQFLHLIMY